MQKPKQVFKELNTAWLGKRSKIWERNLTKKEAISWCFNSRRQLLPAEWAVQKGIKSGSGNGIWNAHERKSDFARKQMLFVLNQQVPHAFIVWVKLKLQLNKNRDLTLPKWKISFAFFAFCLLFIPWSLAPHCFSMLLLHASLHRLGSSSLNSPQRAIIEKLQQWMEQNFLSVSSNRGNCFVHGRSAGTDQLWLATTS